MGEIFIMATNNFKPFGTATGANVTGQTDYEALPSLSNGFQSGKASSAQINKALRQGTVMASVLAQYISDSAGVDVLDNGNTAVPLANLKAGLLRQATGRLNGSPVVIASSGTYTPRAGTNAVLVYILGGGGGGGGTTAVDSSSASAGGGGGGGGLAAGYFSNGFSGISVTIGAGGAGNLGAAGSSGGATSFGSLLAVSGGLAGAAGGAQSSSYFYSGGQGGVLTSGTVLYSKKGSPGNIGQVFNNLTALGGYGGGSDYGQGGANPGATVANQYAYGNPGVGNGSGGSGGVAANGSPVTKGGNGTSGLVIIWEFT